MTTIKSYTDISQSKKLADILPIESADMSWKLVSYGDEAGSRHEPSLATYKTVSFFRDRIFPKDHTIPCWSLAALLDILPNIIGDCFKTINCLYGWHCAYMNGNGEIIDNDTEADNPVDACVAMIEKLHELNLL